MAPVACMLLSRPDPRPLSWEASCTSWPQVKINPSPHSHVNEQLLQIRAFSVFCFLTSTPSLPGENSKREAVQSQGYVG